MEPHPTPLSAIQDRTREQHKHVIINKTIINRLGVQEPYRPRIKSVSKSVCSAPQDPVSPPRWQEVKDQDEENEKNRQPTAKAQRIQRFSFVKLV